ncbi:hypothetical protein MOQ72_38705 [Saccharopolyspora sp. K220]|uniref:hypothetical protein n=1 Tax=Saccharopolyspora soli TaxID=2926618 RepID=UPI001F563795|nr:hypothetical protein [Saccharopolyspora soli]MCI2423367.1 hypothetical protein [Saccharopolyspora soli]
MPALGKSGVRRIVVISAVPLAAATAAAAPGQAEPDAHALAWHSGATTGWPDAIGTEVECPVPDYANPHGKIQFVVSPAQSQGGIAYPLDSGRGDITARRGIGYGIQSF